ASDRFFMSSKAKSLTQDAGLQPLRGMGGLRPAPGKTCCGWRSKCHHASVNLRPTGDAGFYGVRALTADFLILQTRLMLKFLNDCAHILKAPHGNRLALFTGLMTNQKRLGFNVFHPDPGGISFLYREIFARQNYYFRAETDSPLIFDCGANIGMSTLYFKWLFPKSRIRCFEPDPYTYQILNKNIANNRLELIKTFQCALWDEEKKLDFFIDSKRPATTVMSAFPERGVTQAIEVSAEKLSNFISESVDFLKLDVEGAETRVVQE